MRGVVASGWSPHSPDDRWAAGGGASPLPDVRLRTMRRRDLGAVLDIERRVSPRPWSPGVFETELERSADRRYLVATARVGAGAARRLDDRFGVRRVVGFAGVLVGAGEAHVTTIAVDPALHRRKLATRLLLGLLDAALELGADAATLEVRVANAGARRLYEEFGFAPVGVRPGYYAETGEDALVMWLHDLAGRQVARRLDAQRRRLGLPGGASGAADLVVPWVVDRVGLATTSERGGDAT